MSREKPKHPICYLCRKPITGKVYWQGGDQRYNIPAHKGCVIVIKPSKRHGGGI